MLPSQFIKIKKVPLTQNGKVDKKSLFFYDTKLDTGINYAAPGNEIEEIMADIWKEALNLDKVGIHDNFFDLGGDSLKIIKVMIKMRKIFKRDIPVVTMYQYPSINSLSNFLRQDKKDDDEETELQKLNQMEETMQETIRLFDEV